MEVRFEDLHIETSVYTESGRNVPNVLNAYRDIFEWAFLKVQTLLQVCHGSGGCHQSVIVSNLFSTAQQLVGCCGMSAGSPLPPRQDQDGHPQPPVVRAEAWAHHAAAGSASCW